MLGLIHRHKLSCPLVHFKNEQGILQEDLPLCYPFREIPAAKHGFELLSRSSAVPFFIFFLYLHLFDGARFQYFQVLVIFPFLW